MPLYQALNQFFKSYFFFTDNSKGKKIAKLSSRPEYAWVRAYHASGRRLTNPPPGLLLPPCAAPTLCSSSLLKYFPHGWALGLCNPTVRPWGCSKTGLLFSGSLFPTAWALIGAELADEARILTCIMLAPNQMKFPVKATASTPERGKHFYPPENFNCAPWIKYKENHSFVLHFFHGAKDDK